MRSAFPEFVSVFHIIIFRCRPMSVLGLSLLGLKRIRGFVSILRSINPTIIIIIAIITNQAGCSAEVLYLTTT